MNNKDREMSYLPFFFVYPLCHLRITQIELGIELYDFINNNVTLLHIFRLNVDVQPEYLRLVFISGKDSAFLTF